ncbi:hypothetical protein ABPG74_000980 [Tetrahymena malaccensis]
MNQRMYEQEYQYQDNDQFVNQQHQKVPSNTNMNQNDYLGQDQSGIRNNRLSSNMQHNTSYEQEHNNLQKYNQNYDAQGGNNYSNQNLQANNMYSQFNQQNNDQQNQMDHDHNQQAGLLQGIQNQQNQQQQHYFYDQQNQNQQGLNQHEAQYIQEQPISKEHENNYVQGLTGMNQNNFNQGGQIINQLDDVEMELPEEQSQEERQSNDNISRYIVRHNEAGVGFLRKLNQSAYGKKSVIRSKIDQLFDTLDEKAQLQNQFKTLAQYERKVDIQPISNDGKPVILIKWNETNQMFELNEEVLQVFKQIEERKNSKVSFVSITGEKYSGKTFLLNGLLQNNVHQERLQSSYFGNSIIMWSEPIYDKVSDSEIYFLDLNVQQDMSEELKEKLFFIQCIISNVLLFNVKSDQIKAQDFKYLKHLLKMQNHFDFDSLESKEDLKYLMPKICIVMRDFTHEIKKQGYTLSGQQYLEEYLFDDMQFTKANAQEQKLRRRFIKYFPERDLYTMVTPVNSNDIDAQQKLSNLNGVSLDELDPVFLSELTSLRKKIVSQNEIRSIRGIRFSKNMFVQYIQSFLEDANSNQKFDIDKAISILLENEFITVYHECVDTYKRVMEQHFGECEFMSLEQMNDSLRNAREQVYYHFFRLKAHDVEIAEQFFTKYYELLKEFIRDMENQFHTINNEETARIVTQIIKDKVVVIQQKTKNDTFKIEDIMFIKQQFEGILNEVKNTCVGSKANYGETYGIFVTQIQKTMMDVIVSQINNQRNTNKNQLNDLKQQTASLNKKLNQIKEENKGHLKQSEASAKERAQQQDELQKIQKQEANLNAQLKNQQEQLEYVKRQSERYQQAQKEKVC